MLLLLHSEANVGPRRVLCPDTQPKACVDPALTPASLEFFLAAHASYSRRYFIGKARLTHGWNFKRLSVVCPSTQISTSAEIREIPPLLWCGMPEVHAQFFSDGVINFSSAESVQDQVETKQEPCPLKRTTPTTTNQTLSFPKHIQSTVSIFSDKYPSITKKPLRPDSGVLIGRVFVKKCLRAVSYAFVRGLACMRPRMAEDFALKLLQIYRHRA